MMTENFGATAIRGMAPDELNKLKLELAQHAGYIRTRYFFRTHDPNDLPEGETIGSIVSLAIEKLMTGDWKWNPAKDPDLKKYLKTQIKNLLSDLSTKKDNTLFTSPPGEDSAEFASWDRGSEKRDLVVDWMARRDPTPEEALLAKARDQREQEAIEMLKEEAKDDPNVLLYILAAQKGCDKRREIADVTGLEVDEVSLAKKRLDRLIPKVAEKIRTAENTRRRAIS